MVEGFGLEDCGGFTRWGHRTGLVQDVSAKVQIGSRAPVAVEFLGSPLSGVVRGAGSSCILMVIHVERPCQTDSQKKLRDLHNSTYIQTQLPKLKASKWNLQQQPERHIIANYSKLLWPKKLAKALLDPFYKHLLR